MTRTLRTASAALLATLIAATPAYASLADWLDKLGEMSGPGPWIQRAGVALDFVCLEGQWWKDPAIDRPLLDSAAFEQEVVVALKNRANSPFKISAVISALLQRKSADVPRLGVLDGLEELVALYHKNEDATLRVLKQRALTQYWILRERILAEKGQSVAGFLAANGYDAEDSNSPDVGILQDTLKLAINSFCVGDLRKHRLSVGLYTAWFTTDTLPASFAYPPDTASLSPRINAYPLAATFTTTLPFVSEAHPAILRSWDLALSVGAIYFQSEDDQRFEGFWLGPYFEFPRIRLRPLAGVACQVRKGNCPGQWTSWDLFEVEFVHKWLPDYDRQQFGALPGDSTGREGQWWLRIGVSIKFNNDQRPERLVPIRRTS